MLIVRKWKTGDWKGMAENRTEIKQREYLIGDMSEIVGVSRDTLRFYEKKGS